MPATPRQHLPRPAWDDLSARTDLSVARRRVLETIERSDEPMTAVQLAAALDLHHNTVREHLDSLIEAGFIDVSTRSTGRRGRPSLRYTATAPDPGQVLESYLTLLEAIAETMGDTQEARALALQIGRRWAELTPTSRRTREPRQDASPSEQIALLLPALSLMGFSPQAKEDEIVLTACPLVTGGRSPHPLVCLMHQGFLTSVSERVQLSSGPQPEDRARLSLVPLDPDGCHVRLSPEA